MTSEEIRRNGELVDNKNPHFDRYRMPGGYYVCVYKMPAGKSARDRPMRQGNFVTVARWTEREERLIIDNMDKPLDELIRLFPGRTSSAIKVRRTQLRKRLDK